MKNIHYLIFVLIVAILVSGCRSTSVTAIPTITKTQMPLATLMSPTFTATPYITPTTEFTPSFAPIPSSTHTPTATLLPSPDPKQASEIIKILFQESIQCVEPCFAGIVPEKTSLGEAKSFFSNLGLELKRYPLDNQGFNYGATLLSKEVRMSIKFTGNDELIENLEIGIDPEKQQVGVPRKWLIYSLETLIPRFGQPSKVELFLDRGGNATPLDITVYFDRVNLIIEYYILNLGRNTRICPLTDQFENVRVWMGKDPLHPPSEGGEPLEKTTFLTIESFSKLMTGDPLKACFDLKVNMFP